MKNWLVLGSKGCGSVIVEAALRWAKISYDREEVDYGSPAGRERLLPLNPLAQVPTVILPDGTVMTESLALILHVDDLVPGLIPAKHDPLRPRVLRHLTFLVSAIYPTFSYGDDPAKWVGDAGPALAASTLAHRQRLWRYLDGEARDSRHFLGSFSAIDLYLAVMTRWTPGRPWFAEHAPTLHAIASSLDHDPRFATLWADNF